VLNYRWFVFLPFIWFLTGCPYSADVPLDVAKEKVNPDYIGKWVKVYKSSEENPKYYQVIKKAETHSIFEEFNYSSSDIYNNFTKRNLRKSN